MVACNSTSTNIMHDYAIMLQAVREMTRRDDTEYSVECRGFI